MLVVHQEIKRRHMIKTTRDGRSIGIWPFFENFIWD
jgi:hypothetical protein